MLGQYMTSIGYGAYGNNEYGFGVDPVVTTAPEETSESGGLSRYQMLAIGSVVAAIIIFFAMRGKVPFVDLIFDQFGG